MPVGPGHEELCNRASQSVAVAVDYTMGPFSTVKVIAQNDFEGTLGRSAARNKAVAAAETEWLFFLDADDLMHPEAFANIGSHTKDFDAVWGLTTELKDMMIQTRYQVPVIRDYASLIKHDPFMSIKMGHFVRREVALAAPFDTSMNCGEDWDYYLRVWWSARCIKIPVPFFIKHAGHHSTGPRSATGRQWNVAVNAMLEEARAEARDEARREQELIE